MTNRSAVHATFTLERVYPHAPSHVYNAFANAEAKAKWFSGGENWTPMERKFDFRLGGHEVAIGKWKDGPVTQFHATYHDIVPDERLVYSYYMYLDDKKISVSLATLQFTPEGKGTKLTITEQGTFLDGYDDNGSRERGTAELLKKVGDSL